MSRTVPIPMPRILVVEDDDAIRALLIAALAREPFPVDAAADGAAALQLAAERDDYAVIVLDLMMPRLNGFEFLEAFYRLERQTRPVVIVVTAFDDGKIAKLDAGQVHAVIRKPFDVTTVVAIVGEIAETWLTQTAGGQLPGFSRPESSEPVEGRESPIAELDVRHRASPRDFD